MFSPIDKADSQPAMMESAAELCIETSASLLTSLLLAQTLVYIVSLVVLLGIAYFGYRLLLEALFRTGGVWEGTWGRHYKMAKRAIAGSIFVIGAIFVGCYIFWSEELPLHSFSKHVSAAASELQACALEAGNLESGHNDP